MAGTDQTPPLADRSPTTWRRWSGEALGPNHAFLVGHGTIRSAVVGPAARPATDLELKAMVRHLREALDAGAIGLSSGLIYAPGIHAGPEELVRLATVTREARRALREPHPERVGWAVRCPRRGGRDDPRGRTRARGSRSRTSRPARSRPGAGVRTPSSCSRRRARRDSTSPPTSTRTPPPRPRSRSSCRRRMLALPIDAIVEALGGPRRARPDQAGDRDRRAGLGERRAATRAGRACASPIRRPTRDWIGHTLAELGTELDRDPADVAFDLLADDRLAISDRHGVHDRAGRRGDHGVALDRGLHRRRRPPPGPPDPRRRDPPPAGLRQCAAGPRTVRPRTRDPRRSKTAIAKLTSVPAERIGLTDRGRDPARSVRRPRRVRSGDRRRRGDRSSTPIAIRPGSTRHRERGRRRSLDGRRDRAARRTAPAAGRRA